MKPPHDPFGTTRKGQAILAVGGGLAGFGFIAGLIPDRRLFEPVLELFVDALGTASRASIAYEPSKYFFYIGALALVTLVWIALSTYSFMRQPAVDRAIDTNLRSRQFIDSAKRATMGAENDPPN